MLKLKFVNEHKQYQYDIIQPHIDDETGRLYLTGRQIQRVKRVVKANRVILGTDNNITWNLQPDFRLRVEGCLAICNVNITQGYFLTDN